ncbi:MAG: hypothetical protein ACO3NK_16095, partial [Prochlorotrichaceae cyanobacterium]
IFLLVLGGLLIIRVWLPPTFDGIDPEQFISDRHRSRAHPKGKDSRALISEQMIPEQILKN